MIVKVWGVLEGPTSVDALPEEEFIPDSAQYFLVCKSEVDGKMGEDLFWFEDLADAYEWQKYFLNNFEPLEIDMGSDPEYN